MTTELFQLAGVVFIAAALAFLAKILKQPLILGYVLAGLVMGYFGFFRSGRWAINRDFFQVFSDLGIVFLLFLVGLEINYKTLRAVGKTSLIVGIGQVVFTSFFGFFIARFFHFGVLSSVYLAVAFTFSSTIIILKLISERGETHSLYGKISLGLLLVQDLVAIILLIILAGLGSGDNLWWQTILTLIKGVLFFGAMIYLGREALPFVFDKVARLHELLFLISLAWVFLVVAIVKQAGFSIEAGGFLAGLALANSAENFQIAAKVKPLRDFFMVIFFVILGSSLVFSASSGIFLKAIIFSIFILIGNPFIVFVLMSILGYRKRTSFLTGLTVAQISEFSLVLVAGGLRLGHLSESAASLVTVVAVITITISTYLMAYADNIFKIISPFLSIFERKRFREEEGIGDNSTDIILIGCHRIGQSIAFGLPKERTLIVDFDLDVVRDLQKHGFKTLLGDVSDPDIMERLPLNRAILVISTSPVLEDNLTLLSFIKELSARPKMVVRAEDERDARFLYDKGADYVIAPCFTAGQYFGKTVAIDPEMSILHQLREKDLVLMKRIAKATI